MRTHEQIISDAGGYRLMAEKIGQPESRTRFWERRKAIPYYCWRMVAASGIATLDELIIAAEQKAATRYGDAA